MLLGQPISVRLELPGGKQQRYFAGICSRVTQGESTHKFTDYRLEMVPAFWLLTRRAQSLIFQHKNVPDILKEVLQGLDVER
jgi:type VI secretion system secreted protein VgrG